MCKGPIVSQRAQIGGCNIPNCMSTYPGRDVASRKREVPNVSRLLGEKEDQSMPIEEGGCEMIACKKRHAQWMEPFKGR